MPPASARSRSLTPTFKFADHGDQVIRLSCAGTIRGGGIPYTAPLLYFQNSDQVITVLKVTGVVFQAARQQCNLLKKFLVQ
jgi:hypothetical protein